MTARELIEEGVDVERGAANVAKILSTSSGQVFYSGSTNDTQKPARKRRSDAGKPKAKKQEAPAGVIVMELSFSDEQLLDCVRYFLEQDSQSVIVDMFAGLLKQIARLNKQIQGSRP